MDHNEALTNALVRTLHGASSRGATPEQVRFHNEHAIQDRFIAYYEARDALLEELRTYPGYQEAATSEDWAPDEAELALDQFTTWFTWGN